MARAGEKVKGFVRDDPLCKCQGVNTRPYDQRRGTKAE